VPNYDPFPGSSSPLGVDHEGIVRVEEDEAETLVVGADVAVGRIQKLPRAPRTAAVSADQHGVERSHGVGVLV